MEWIHENLIDYIQDGDIYLAHMKEDNIETLEQHSNLVFSYFKKMIKEKQLNAVFSNFMEKLELDSEEEKKLFLELVTNTIYFHDFGKINKMFQIDKMQNLNFNQKEKVLNDSNHSIFSSVFYFCVMWMKIKNQKRKELFEVLIILNAYIISRHHTDLENGCFIEKNSTQTTFALKMKEAVEKITNNSEQFSASKIVMPPAVNIERLINLGLKKLNEKEKLADISYFYIRFLFSLLVSADFYATTEFMLGIETQNFGVMNDVVTYQKYYQNTEIYHSIKKYKENNEFLKYDKDDINKLRAELFIESEKTLMENLSENIFYLEAPTGSGKTNMSINLGLQLIENSNVNKIFYIFPYNALVEQTKNSLETIFGNNEKLRDYLGIINSLTAYGFKEKKGEDAIEGLELSEAEYSHLVQQRQFLQYPLVLTTHVNFFTYLFGRKREQNLPLWQLANSVIILDEIQSYKNSIWTEIIYFLDKYAKTLNLKVIIMSATLPDLAQLIQSKTNYVRLNEHADYYSQHPLFKNRVVFKNELIEQTRNLEIAEVFQVLKAKIEQFINLNQEKILIEFMYKKNALKFYKLLKEKFVDLGYMIEVITGDDNIVERQRIINLTKQDKKIILIATQVIEAGVDIDMDVGLKQVSLFDSEEQFAGRINRSSKKTRGEIHFFKINERNLYINDIRALEKFTINDSLIFSMLERKDFAGYYNLILSEIKSIKHRANDENFTVFKQEKINGLNFVSVEEKMRLIEDREMFTLILAQSKESEKVLNIWKTYLKINELKQTQEISYAEWKVKVTQLYIELNQYSYQVAKYYQQDLNLSSDDKFGDMYLFLNADAYFEDGKFMREYLSESLQSTYEII